MAPKPNRYHKQLFHWHHLPRRIEIQREPLGAQQMILGLSSYVFVDGL